MNKIITYFLISLFLYGMPFVSFAFPDLKKINSVFIDTPADFNRSDVRVLGFPENSALPQKSTIVIPDINSPSKIGYIVIPMGKSGNKVFLEFSLLSKAPNNYALAYGLANNIAGNELGSLSSIEKILTDNYTIKDPAMKYPSQKNLIVKLHETGLPGSKKNTLGNFVIQDGPSDIINIVIDKRKVMQRTFIHEFIHFFNRDVIDGNSSIMLSETLTLLFEDECFNSYDYKFCNSSKLYNSITSKGVMDPKKLVDVISESLLANNYYKGYEYQSAELLGRVLMEKLAIEMPNASKNQRIIEATKRITAAQKDFSRITPIQLSVSGNDTLFSSSKALNTVAATLGFSEGFHEMAAAMSTYYEMNVYAEAKSINALIEELGANSTRRQAIIQHILEQMSEKPQAELLKKKLGTTAQDIRDALVAIEKDIINAKNDAMKKKLTHDKIELLHKLRDKVNADKVNADAELLKKKLGTTAQQQPLVDGPSAAKPPAQAPGASKPPPPPPPSPPKKPLPRPR